MVNNTNCTVNTTKLSIKFLVHCSSRIYRNTSILYANILTTPSRDGHVCNLREAVGVPHMSNWVGQHDHGLRDGEGESPAVQLRFVFLTGITVCNSNLYITLKHCYLKRLQASCVSQFTVSFLDWRLACSFVCIERREICHMVVSRGIFVPGFLSEKDASRNDIPEHFFTWHWYNSTHLRPIGSLCVPETFFKQKQS